MDMASLQAAQIFCAFGLGLSLGVLYDWYRLWLHALGGSLRLRRRLRLVGDLLWWLVALAWVAVALIRINWAELRVPVIIMVFLGLIIYLFYFSPVLRGLYLWLGRLIGQVLHALWAVILRLLWLIFAPIVALSGLLYRLLAGVGTTVERVCLGAGRASRRAAGKGRRRQQARALKRQERRTARRAAKQAANGDEAPPRQKKSRKSRKNKKPAR